MNVLTKTGSVLYRWWMRFARALAFVNTRIILTLVFFIVIGPIALIVQLVRKDFLDRTMGSGGTYWKPKAPVDHSLEEASRQF